MNINLEHLPDLAILFKQLNAGTHLNRHLHNQLWTAIEKNAESYQALFKALGFEFIIDARGFAYFKTDQGNPNTHKLTQRLALIMLLLFEYQANAGIDLSKFELWIIDHELLNTIWQITQVLLEAEEIHNPAELSEIFDSGCRVGFITKENNHYRLLAAVHRYLDLFIELQNLAQAKENNSDEN